MLRLGRGRGVDWGTSQNRRLPYVPLFAEVVEQGPNHSEAWPGPGTMGLNEMDG